MELQVLISTAELESIFFETFRQELGLKLSDFNATQLDMLLQKHYRAYCLGVAFDVLYYHVADKAKHNHLSMQASSADMNFKHDFHGFLTRFLFWTEEQSTEFIERFKNVLTTVFMMRLNATAGVDLYDSRQYKLRGFEHSLERSTASERVLLVTFETVEVRFDGPSLAL